LDQHGSFTEEYDQSLIDPKYFTLHHLTGSESGGGHLPAGFFASSGPQSENEHGGERKQRIMNPLIQFRTTASDRQHCVPLFAMTIALPKRCVQFGCLRVVSSLNDAFVWNYLKAIAQLTVNEPAVKIAAPFFLLPPL
jgi:hypothetical protein